MSEGAGATTRTATLGTVVRVTSGNFLEMFDFFLAGIYAGDIARAFFPAGSEFLSLMLTFGTFGAGFLMRPLGALVLGAYVDRLGRRRGLILTLSIMACGTVLVAFVPAYATIGIAAPLLVLVGRLLQGFSAGVEIGGVSVYLAEIATPGHEGFFASWQSASQQVAIIVAALLGYAITALLPAAEIADWGWRIPFFVGCLIVPFVFVIRRSLRETEAFLSRPPLPDMRTIVRSLAENWYVVLAGTLMVVMTTVSFYLITVYTPTFGRTVLKLTPADGLVVTFCVGLSNFVWLPVMGALSDRVGRWPLLATFTILALLTGYPALRYLVAAPSFSRMLGVELWLSFLYASYNGAMIIALTEIMPVSVRTSGFSLAYSFATALGGFTAAISTLLIKVLNDGAAPGIWMSFAAACGLAAVVMIRGRRHAPVVRGSSNPARSV